MGKKVTINQEKVAAAKANLLRQAEKIAGMVADAEASARYFEEAWKDAPSLRPPDGPHMYLRVNRRANSASETMRVMPGLTGKLIRWGEGPNAPADCPPEWRESVVMVSTVKLLAVLKDAAEKIESEMAWIKIMENVSSVEILQEGSDPGSSFDQERKSPTTPASSSTDDTVSSSGFSESDWTRLKQPLS